MGDDSNRIKAIETALIGFDGKSGLIGDFHELAGRVTTLPCQAQEECMGREELNKHIDNHPGPTVEKELAPVTAARVNLKGVYALVGVQLALGLISFIKELLK